MVKDSREKASPSRIRPLNQPGVVQVVEGKGQIPLAVHIRHRQLNVKAIEDVWEVVDEWWRVSTIARRYYQVVTEEGASVTVYRDLIGGKWYEQRV